MTRGSVRQDFGYLRGNGSRAFLVWSAVMLLLVGSLGCTPARVERWHWTSAEARRRAVQPFAEGVLFKPAADSPNVAGLKLAPIFVKERAAATAEIAPFGAWVEDDSGAWFVDLSSPAVYAASSEAVVNGAAHPQWVYLWFSGGALASSPPVAWGMLRITLDSTGFPAIWEVYASRVATALIFVSKATEEAAENQFGPGAKGRFAVQQPGRGSGSAIVVRVLDDGPEPMGPMVYLDARGQVTTVTCRCMPAQVRAITRNDYFSLRSIPELAELGGWPAAQTLFLPSPPVALPEEIDAWSASDFLSGILRLADGF